MLITVLAGAVVVVAVAVGVCVGRVRALGRSEMGSISEGWLAANRLQDADYVGPRLRS